MNQTAFAAESFVNPSSRREFVIVSGITFLCFLSMTMLVFLPKLMHNAGLNEAQIGTVMSATAIPVLLANLGGGILVGRIGTIPLIALALLLVAAGTALPHFVLRDFGMLILSRIVFGSGIGLMITAGMVHAKSLLTSRHFVYLFGMYSTMFTLPFFLGPFLGETYLTREGVNGFFLAASVPVCVGLLLVLGLRTSLRPADSSRANLRYWSLLIDRRLMRPFLLAAGFGIIWGFPFPFMALLLSPEHIPVAYFFSVNTAAVFLSRFVLLGYVQQLPRPTIVLLGLLASCAAYAVLCIGSLTSISVLAAGLLSGVGHGLVFPSLSTWVSDEFVPAMRGKPVALFNTMFNAGGYLMPLVGGLIISAMGMRALLAMIAVIALFLAGTLLVSRTDVAAEP